MFAVDVWLLLHFTMLNIVVSVFSGIAIAAPATTKMTSRSVKILNVSGSRVEIYWIHPETREGSLMSSPHIVNGGDFSLNSFVGHEFEVRELPSKKSGLCSQVDQTCGFNFFKVSENDDQLVTVEKGIKIEFLDDQIRAQLEASEIVENCQKKAKNHLLKAVPNVTDIENSMNDLVKCVGNGVTETLLKANNEIIFQSKIRKEMAEIMENYTCADPDVLTTEALRNEYWRGARDRRRRKVEVLFDRPASRIMLVSDFISPDECDAMALAAKPKLHKATVADGKGGSHLSEHRKAMQAGISVHWEKESSGDHIATLSRRVYDFTNHVLDLDIQEFGQEDLMSIQYFGNGIHDKEPDRYTPHCDGDCKGLPHKSGTRVATMVMYCTIPENGGHTNFRNAGVHVKPISGNAVFFSYIDPVSLVMDNGYTEHSGCPVFEGEKKIVTQWIRLGVDRNNPWDSFNSMGVKISDDDD